MHFGPCRITPAHNRPEVSEVHTWRLPDTGFLRLQQIIKPHGVYPVSRSEWYDGVKNGKYPAPVKLGPRTSAWRVEQIRALIEDLNGK